MTENEKLDLILSKLEVIDKRFEKIDERFEKIEKDISDMKLTLESEVRRIKDHLEHTA